MKYLVCILIIIIILSIFLKKTEGFVVYQLNYKTDILPPDGQPVGLQGTYTRCVCSSDEDCRCLNDYQLDYILDY
jgi:hypothetical protein